MSVIAIGQTFKFAPKSLEPSERLVMLAIADAVDDEHRMTFESVRTMAIKANISERQVYRVLNTLAELGILETVPDDQRPQVSLRYKSAVRRLTEPADWREKVVTLEQPEATPDTMSPLTPSSDNPSKLLANRHSPHRSYFVTPNRSNEAKPRCSKKSKTDPDAGLDPELVVWGAEESSDHPVADQILGDADETTVRRTRLRKGKDPHPDTAIGLVAHFEQQLVSTGADWSIGLQPGNRRVMGRSLAEWRRSGVTADQVRAMIDVYVTEPTFRDKRVVPWKDFLAKRNNLATRVQQAEESRASEDHRFDDNYWKT